MNPLISVIVPIYKVEKFLDRCIESIVEQTYQNLEIILVDDGSPDNCGKMCDEWAKKDPRIKAYHKENGGLSDARNFGTSKSTAEYIAFIDSDDYVLPEYIEVLYNNLVEYDADISCCKMKLVYSEDRELSFPENDTASEPQKMTGRDACFKMYLREYVDLIMIPAKIYKKDIITKYPFPLGRLCEDAFTDYKFLYESKNVVTSKKALYSYYQNPNSIMNTPNPQRMKDVAAAYMERATYFSQKNEVDLKRLACEDLAIRYLLDCGENNTRISKEHISFLKSHGFNGDLTLSTLLKFIFYAISPTLYKNLWKLIK